MLQGKKTGVINDTFMLKHKTKKVHPEKPKRVEEIMERLKTTGILQHPHVDFISEYDRLVTDDEIMYAHSKKYLDYFNNIWPKETHRHDLTVIDTYFCQHSNKAARMSAGGVILGAEKVLNGEWKNGFAVVRPPGHHAGVRNILNGFCLLNNVAIGARHLQKKFGLKKIAILDWDVHRGDGTHTIFEEDREVLFISVHRYDHGIYYPSGEQGNYDNCGKGEAEGTKVNIPLNHYDENYTPYSCQPAGDNQYVYIYHRLIEPIIKQFEPQFLLISCGFDASRFDPLGDFTVTPNGFYYMARRLAQIGIPVLGVLEGGYNPEQLALGVDAVIHGFLSEKDLPEPVDNINFDNMKELCQVNQEYHNDIDKIVQYHSKYWKSLQSQELIKYTQKIKANKERLYGFINENDDNYESSSEEEETKQQHEKETQPQKKLTKAAEKEAQKEKQSNEQLVEMVQKANNKQQTTHEEEECSQSEENNQFCFACGHMQRFKNFSMNNEKALKWAYPEEHDFYSKQYPEAQFAPKFFGKDGKYLILENVLYKLEDHVVADLKIGRFSKKAGLSSKRLEKQIKKENASTTSKYAFRLSGFTTPNYKEGGLLVSDENVLRKMFEKLVTAENKAYYVDFLKRLAETLKKANRKYYNTSIFITKGKNRSTIKWIDFHYWEDNADGYDEQSVEGLENMRKFIEEVDVNAAHK